MPGIKTAHKIKNLWRNNHLAVLLHLGLTDLTVRLTCFGSRTEQRTVLGAFLDHLGKLETAISKLTIM